VTEPRGHRTVDRITEILEVVGRQPGVGFAELARTLDAPKSSIHGFIRGLVATGWLHEANRRFYLGPAAYALTLSSGQVRAGSVRQEHLNALHEAVGLAVVLGVRAGDHLIYVARAGEDAVTGFRSRSNIRRPLLGTAGGKALLAASPPTECDAYLERFGPDGDGLVQGFRRDAVAIRRTRIATNAPPGGSRFGIATAIPNQKRAPVASLTVVGPAVEVEPRASELGATLVAHADEWSRCETDAREVV
jgi:DNA-binding IclR family transcriptional regulator